MSEVTQILTAIERGKASAAEDLLPLVYDELRQLASQRLSRERAGQTLQATALVHEVWLRLSGAEAWKWNGLRHFFYATAGRSFTFHPVTARCLQERSNKPA